MNIEKQIPFNPDLSAFSKEELAFHIPETAKRRLGELAINE